MKCPPPLRLAIPLALLVFATIAGLITRHFANKFEMEMIDTYAERRANLAGTHLSAMSAFLFESGPIFAIEREVALTAVDRDIEVALVFSENGRALFSSRADLRSLPIDKTPAEAHKGLLARVHEQRAGLVEFSSDRKRLFGAFPFQIARRMGGSLREPEVGFVYLEFDLSHRKKVAAAEAARRDRLAIVVVLALCGLISLLFWSLLGSRVHRLAEAARRLAGGDLSARSEILGGDELAQVSRAIDEMASHLERSNAELRETAARFQFLVDGIPQVFWYMEIEPERFLYAGKSFERIWGLPVSELFRDPDVWIACVHPEDRARASEAFLSWITGRSAGFDETYRIRRPDGEERWIRDRGIRLEPSQEGHKRIAGLAEDITTEHLRTTAQEDFDRKLRETQKLESLGVLAGGIAHDFNNLLAGILGNASMAREEAAPADPAQPYLQHIESAAMRAAELCKQMLAYSGKGRFEVQRLDLSELVQSTTQLIQLSIAKNATLRLNLAEHLPAIKADPSRLRQVIMNLVINASEAIGGANGVLTITTGVAPVSREDLRQAVLSPALPEGDYVFLKVSDTGCGMSAETQARIFEPFFTTKFAGRGLGLSAVLGIMRGHGGALRVVSEENKGATFRLIFPIVEGEPEPIEDDHRVEPWTGSGTVLIIDDDQLVRTAAIRMVEKLGFTAITAHDGRSGVEAFRTHRESIVAVLLDLTMPHMDGEQAFRQLREIARDVRVILMSGYTEHDAINRFTGKGMAGFIQKPFHPDALRKKLRDVLEAK